MKGDSLRVSGSNKRLEARVSSSGKLPETCIIRLSTKVFSQKAQKCISSMKQGGVVSGAAGDVAAFLLTTAALEIVRRFSKAKCSFIWRGLQTLQLLCYPPFKWIQRWAPFKGLVKNMQTLSKPMLVLSIATVFSDEPTSVEGAFSGSNDVQASTTSQPEASSQSLHLNGRSHDEVPKSLTPDKWLLELYKELDKQGIIIPERLNEEELRRFYVASDGDFSRLLSSIKKTIRWRQTYTLLSSQELEAWSHLVFWHGCDVKRRPCLIIRLGLACSNSISIDRSLFARAVVSQIEHGVLNLIDLDHPQLTVLMDCEGLSPFGFPVQMMRSCAVLLQDHYPNRLGWLLVVRLPPIALVVTKTLFQVLKPKTRKKLRVVGGDHQEVLSKYFEALPPFLGGNCSCSKCSESSFEGINEEIMKNSERVDFTDDSTVPLPDCDHPAETSVEITRELVRTAIIGAVILWIILAFILGMYYPQMLHQLYSRCG